MHITDLKYFEAINSDEHLIGGNFLDKTASEDTLSIDFSDGILSLKQGNKLLFREAIKSPKKIVFSLEGLSFPYGRTISTTTNGKTTTSITISTNPFDATSSPLGFSWFAL